MPCRCENAEILNKADDFMMAGIERRNKSIIKYNRIFDKKIYSAKIVEKFNETFIFNNCQK
ncbi:MAG: hypothetical protein KA120_01470 [Candidatus Goldbacteria bacterium]|nr:hypothetical protein [Candidatus Goldiibacteriota bacterium]